jgi:DNA-binding response OmpR family regulator
MMHRAVVLSVDDDPAVQEVLQHALGLEGFQVQAATTIQEALDLVNRRPPDLVLLDVMLGGEDGLELLAEIRRAHDMPVILLSGRAEESHRVLGLRMGADDYVVTPFSHPELAARIATVLRRWEPSIGRSSRRAFGDLSIDEVTREVVRAGTVIDTTAREFDLLAFLTRSPRQVFSRQQLLEGVWASSAEWQDPATVTEHVRRLRLKIEADADHPRWIVTVRGVGYRFEP